MWRSIWWNMMHVLCHFWVGWKHPLKFRSWILSKCTEMHWSFSSTSHKLKKFVCLFDCLFVCLFCSNHAEMIDLPKGLMKTTMCFLFAFAKKSIIPLSWCESCHPAIHRWIGNGRWLSTFWDAYPTVYTLAKTVGTLSFSFLIYGSNGWEQGRFAQRNWWLGKVGKHKGSSLDSDEEHLRGD